MFKSHSSNKKEESDSKSESSAATGWKKGINSVQQIYVAHQYWQDNGMDLDEDVKYIDGDQLKSLRKKSKKVEKALKLSWQVYTVQHVGPKRRKVPKEQSIGQSNQQYVDICVMVKDPRTGKGKMLRALLDSGCTKSIIFKSFTLPKARIQLH